MASLTPISSEAKTSSENPIKQPPDKKPIEKKSAQVAAPILKKDKPTASACKRAWIWLRDHLVAFFKKIADCFRKIFGFDEELEAPDDADDIEMDELPVPATHQVSERLEKDNFSKSSKLLDSIETTYLSRYNPIDPATFTGYRLKSIEKRCQEMASELAELQFSPGFALPRGLANIGNSCYLNSFIQNFTKLYFENSDVKNWNLTLD